MSDELLKVGSITITKSMAKFGDTSYPLANIGAVSIKESAHVLFVIGWVLVAVGVIYMFSHFFFGFILAAIGGALIWSFADKGPGKLMLRTSSGNQQAFESDDKALVKRIKSSIEEAIAARG